MPILHILSFLQKDQNVIFGNCLHVFKTGANDQNKMSYFLFMSSIVSSVINTSHILYN